MKLTVVRLSLVGAAILLCLLVYLEYGSNSQDNYQEDAAKIIPEAEHQSPQKKLTDEEDFEDFFSNAENTSTVRDQIEKMTYEELFAACDTVGYQDYVDVDRVKAFRESADYFIVLKNDKQHKTKLLQVKVFKCVVHFNWVDWLGKGVPILRTEFFITLARDKNEIFKLSITPSLIDVLEGSKNLMALSVANKRKIPFAENTARLQGEAEVNFAAYYGIKGTPTKLKMYIEEEKELEAEGRLGKLKDAGGLKKICDLLGHEEFENVKEMKNVPETINRQIIFQNGKLGETPLEVDVFKCVVLTQDVAEGAPGREKEFFVALGSNENTFFKLLPVPAIAQEPASLPNKPPKDQAALCVSSERILK